MMFKQKPIYIRWILLSILTFTISLIFKLLFQSAVSGATTFNWKFIITLSLLFPALLLFLDKKNEK